MSKKVKFIIREPNTKKVQPIYLRCLYNGTQFRYPTGQTIHSKNWNQKEGEVRNKTEVTDRDHINEELEKLRTRFNEIFKELETNDTLISNEILRDKLNNKDPKKTPKKIDPSIESYLDQFIKDAPSTLIQKADGTTAPLKANTIKQFTTTLNHIITYNKMKDIDLKFIDLNLKFHSKFIKYLREDKHLAMQTIASRIKDLKTISKHAKMEGIKVCEDVFTKEFFKPTDKSVHVYLNETEIQKVFDYDFANDEKLDNVRDLFIIGLRTGLRISDFIRLKETNIQEGYIVIEEIQKTGNPIVIPLHPQIETILEKRKGSLPRLISHTKFNEYIKEVCEKVGFTQIVEGTKHSSPKEVKNKKTGKTEIIYRKETGKFPKHELISSHSCRRSFASNLYGKLPNMVIMSITGHKSEKTFLNYIKITPKEHAETLRSLWMKQVKENNFQSVKMAKV